MAKYFDRYELFRKDGSVKPIPGIFLDPKPTDKKDVYKVGETRMDKLSQKYYGNPYHGFLIMLANPQFGGLEFNIPDGEIITIPFPFNETIDQYISKAKREIELNGK